MTLQEFITAFDKEGAIVLLEGKRDVLPQDQEKLTALGRLLAAQTKHMIFRSGNADGSDLYFSLGVAAVDNSRLQVVTPYAGHRKKTNPAATTVSLDQVDLSEETAVVAQSKSNKKTEKLIDQYVAGDRGRYAIKAAYIIRDTVKAIGIASLPAATCGLFYDDLAQPRSGGTGHTMNVCTQNDIPVFDQTTWFSWLTAY